ncbi:MAG: DUF4177 domain-containing protein [Akkermansia sp.]|nr:DUF4177 domain-containing protein [Akkermansia sp.]
MMNTYFVLDPATNAWSRQHRTLKEIMTTPGMTSSHLLADARTRKTLTVAQALNASQKTTLKTPRKPLLKVPVVHAASPKPTSLAHPLEAPGSRRKRTRCEYKVLGLKDECLNSPCDASTLELLLNTYAQRGWKLLSCFPSGTAPESSPALNHLLLVFERRIAAVPF